MSGHNKWSKIKHKKAATDQAKSREFGVLARLIAVESKKANGDTSSPSLAAAIAKARAANMPGANIDRAVARGTEKDAAMLEQTTYESYGPGGCALIIEAVTDNKNRTTAEMKHLLSQHSSALAQPGAASWAFSRNGAEWKAETTLEINETDGDALGRLIDAIEEHDDVTSVITNAV